MNNFSKKTNIIFVCVSIFLFLASAVFILFSKGLVNYLVPFLENFFHKTIGEEKKGLLISLFSYPVFIVLLVNALVFPKLSNKSKIILITTFIVSICAFLGFVTYVNSFNFINSDMASELILAKECSIEKSFFPKTWNYSTEFRFLNTQLVTSLLFLFTDNYIIVKIISVIILSLLLIPTSLFLFNQLQIKSFWLKLLGCLFIYCPTSLCFTDMIQIGNYYIPHVVISFVLIGLFFAICYKELSIKKNKIFKIIYCVLSLCAGIGGIRYLLILSIPLFLLFLIFRITDFQQNKETFVLKSFITKDKQFYYSFLGLIFCGIGYVINELVIHSLFRFETYTITSFVSNNNFIFKDVFNFIFEAFGYTGDVLLFSPQGIINVLVFVALLFFILCCIDYLKNSNNDIGKKFLLLSFIMFVINLFFIATTSIGAARYILLQLIFIYPCVILLFTDKNINIVKRYILIFSFVLICTTSSFTTVTKLLNSKSNKGKEKVTKFLIENNYELGYATFWNANIFTYLTNGQLKMINITTDEKGERLLKDYKIYRFLTSERYFDEKSMTDLQKKVIFLVTQEEYNLDSDLKIFKEGKLVYSDDYYRVYEYANHKSFVDSY